MTVDIDNDLNKCHIVRFKADFCSRERVVILNSSLVADNDKQQNMLHIWTRSIMRYTSSLC